MRQVTGKAIYFIVEPGLLEQQAMLLVESLSRAGALQGHRVFAINPRSRRLKKNSIQAFVRHGVEYIEKNLNTGYDFYPLMNKILTWAYFEESWGALFDASLFLDTDILANDKLESLFYMLGDGQLGLSPVFQCSSAWRVDEPPPPCGNACSSTSAAVPVQLHR